MAKKKENKKNKDKNKKIILISAVSLVVIILLVFLFKWLLFDRVVKEEKVDISNPEIESLLYKTRAYSYFDRLGDYKESTLSNQEKLWFVVETDDLFDRSLNFYTVGSKVLGKDVKDFYNKYFGNTDIKNEDILCPQDNNPIFEYDQKTDTYVYSNNYEHSHLGDPSIYDKYFYPVSVIRREKANGDILYIVKVNKMFGDTCSDICGITSNFYGTYQDSLNKENAIIKKENYENWENYFTSEEEIGKLYNYSKEKLPIYTYTFLSKDGSYFLEKVGISK